MTTPLQSTISCWGNDITVPDGFYTRWRSAKYSLNCLRICVLFDFGSGTTEPRREKTGEVGWSDCSQVERLLFFIGSISTIARGAVKVKKNRSGGIIACMGKEYYDMSHWGFEENDVPVHIFQFALQMSVAYKKGWLNKLLDNIEISLVNLGDEHVQEMIVRSPIAWKLRQKIEREEQEDQVLIGFPDLLIAAYEVETIFENPNRYE